MVSTAVWSIAGFVATLTMMLVAADNGGAAHDLLTLGPNTLVRALAAAVIAGMVSFPRAMVAGVAIGVVQALINFNYLDKPGLIDGLLLVAVLIAVALQSRGRGPAETQTFSFAPKVREIPEQLRDVWWVQPAQRGRPRRARCSFAIALPLLITQPSRHLLYATIGCFAICGLSLIVLTGWAGQLSLGQMAFAGFGALVAAAFTRGLDLDLGVVHLDLAPLPFLLSIVIAAFASAGLAALIGVGALRVRGLLLAVSTFAFSVAASQYLFRQPVLSDDLTTVPFPRGTLFGLDLSSQRTYYYVCLAVLVVAFVFVSRLRRSGIGRTTIAVRDNADRAAAYTVGVASSKLRAFAIAGFIAGFGGALLAGAVEAVPFTERYFLVADSLALVAIVVIGGIASPMGAVLGSLWIVGLPAFFPDNTLVPLLTSSLGLLILLLYFPGGLMQIAYSARDALVRVGGIDAVRHRRPNGRRDDAPGAAAAGAAADRRATSRRSRWSGITVRFGGVVAVDDARSAVGSGRDRRPHRHQRRRQVDAHERDRRLRAVRGRGATPRRRRVVDRRRRAGPGWARPHVPGRAAVPRAHRARDGRGRARGAGADRPPLHRAVPASLRPRANGSGDAEADELIGFLGLGRYANNRIADLSTGTRRIVELAGLLALDARVLCLDEPTAGVAQRETEAFGPLIKEIRRELGAAMLVIEHDMPLIMSISDRVYCLEVGRVIAEGSPDLLRNDPKVIASYLGVDERAIARSGAVPTTTGPPAEETRT